MKKCPLYSFPLRVVYIKSPTIIDFTDGVTSYIVQKKVRSDIKKICVTLVVTLYISVYEHGGHTVYECIIYTV